MTPERWGDLETLFGDRGACQGCWCMFWRVPRPQFDAQQGEGNRRALKVLVDTDRRPGLIAYVDGTPAGWCSVAPREEFPRLATSRNWKPVDDRPVWSITCFFVLKAYRRRGLSGALLRAAVKFAVSRGARMVEGYPVDASKPVADGSVWNGLASVFRKAGFVEVARRSERRPVMRLDTLR